MELILGILLNHIFLKPYILWKAHRWSCLSGLSSLSFVASWDVAPSLSILFTPTCESTYMIVTVEIIRGKIGVSGEADVSNSDSAQCVKDW